VVLVRSLLRPLATGDGRWPVAVAALPRPGSPAWRDRGRARPREAKPALGRSPSRAGSPFSPRAREQAVNSHGPIVFPGPAQRQLKKSSFHFFLLFMLKNTLENIFLVILAPKMVK
jgi:hypothetical protein